MFVLSLLNSALFDADAFVIIWLKFKLDKAHVNNLSNIFPVNTANTMIIISEIIANIHENIQKPLPIIYFI